MQLVVSKILGLLVLTDLHYFLNFKRINKSNSYEFDRTVTPEDSKQTSLRASSCSHENKLFLWDSSCSLGLFFFWFLRFVLFV